MKYLLATFIFVLSYQSVLVNYGMGYLAYALIRIKSTDMFSVNLQPGISLKIYWLLEYNRIVSMAAYIKDVPKFWRQF